MTPLRRLVDVVRGPGPAVVRPVGGPPKGPPCEGTQVPVVRRRVEPPVVL